ncbi:MAG: NAD(P)H-quinone oxidoreductase [Gammaproteobacteria bacterium RIFCSPLOWO2_02_FULL_61_13]|nr:MAG: NAD(P)H-quinone oxidoreductase [Gammaproteobacteria bacterium RIFCSPLOWO2_02_FULL_61_13]
MKYIEISTPGEPEVLRLAEGPRPEPGAGQVLIRIQAAGVNRPDLLQRQGKYPPPPGASLIPGLEVAGEVIAVGPGTEKPAVGQQVCALLAGGGYAEYAVAEAGLCLPVPRGFTMAEAAALPETFFTVWHNVFQRGHLQAGESLLIHGGSSGIGTTAIQLGAAFGARVFATAGTAEKCAACRKLGAELAINYRSEDFVAATTAATQGRGVDVILDMVAGDYVERNFSAAAEDGRIVIIAGLRGYKTEVNLLPLMRKRLTLTGSTLRNRDVSFKAGLAEALRTLVWPLLESGKIRPVLHRMLPLAQAAEAHRLLEAGEHIGKIVLTVK